MHMLKFMQLTLVIVYIDIYNQMNYTSGLFYYYFQNSLEHKLFNCENSMSGVPRAVSVINIFAYGHNSSCTTGVT